jgi:outer membrane protein OmpA-like peptidoglycan-associated protein
MSRLPLLVLCALVSGCATSRVALLPDEGGATVGAVAVLDPKTEAERGQLTVANTQAVLREKSVSPRPLKTNYDPLLAMMPPPPRSFTLYFYEGSTRVTAGSAPTLAELRDLITPASEVQIVGHTDTVGDNASNDKLSLQRAIEIRAALVKEGLPVENARVTGRGQRELRVHTADDVDEPANRRVEVILR